MDWSWRSFPCLLPRYVRASCSRVRQAETHTTATPLFDALKSCAADENVAAFHFPGHGRGASAPESMAKLVGKSMYQYDLPELPGLDNLHSPEGVIEQSQRLAAELFGADSTWFLVNGSTCGVHAAVMSTCRPGDHLILPRNCHLSAVSAMVLSGARPHYLFPVYDPTWEVFHGVAVESVEKAIRQLKAENVRIGAVLIVSPTYFGVCSPIRNIAELCHEHGIPLIVDEAHGAHFRFHTELPATALEQGADLVVQSTHKVLTSLTQSAMLHSGKGSGRLVSSEKVALCLRTLQSSSPSYLLMASLDAARSQMVSTLSSRGDHPLLDNALKLAAQARSSLKQIPGVAVLDEKTMSYVGRYVNFEMDKLRLTVGLWGLGLNGNDVDEFLCEEHKVIAELPSLNSITFAVGTGSNNRDIQRLVDAFEELSRRETCSSNKEAFQASVPFEGFEEQKTIMSPRDVFYAETRRLKAEEAVGYPSAELICPYPPGIPVVFPGEAVSPSALNYLKQALASGVTITGTSDPSLTTLLVCKAM